MLRLVMVVGMLLGMAGAARGQMKRYYDPRTGVSFQYPAAWKSAGYGGNDGMPFVDDAKRPDIRFFIGWQTWDKGGSPRGAWESTFVTFGYVVLPERSAKACATRAVHSEGDPEVVTINGGKFWHDTDDSGVGAGHSPTLDYYTTLHNGRCLGFRVGVDSYSYADKHTMSAAQRRVPANPHTIMQSVRIAR